MWEEETKQYSDPESAKKSGADCQVSTRINYSKTRLHRMCFRRIHAETEISFLSKSENVLL